MYFDQMQGEMSLIVIEGRGNLWGRKPAASVKRGDVIVSEMSEPHTFQATTTLRLLVTITPTGSSVRWPPCLVTQADSQPENCDSCYQYPHCK